MTKIHNEAWAEEMLKSLPPKGYGMTIAEGCALSGMADRVKAVAAAYNYGFKRGQNYERNKSRPTPPQKRNASH